jgi:hypothetical protein
MIDKRQVAGLLAQNISTSDIAQVVGCDDSYVSQLKEDPEVLIFMEEEKRKLSKRDADFDDMLMAAEEDALKIIKRNLPFANASVALNTFRVLNSATKRAGQHQHDPQVAVTVNLVLPQAMLPSYITNDRKEIIEVEGRTMLSATPKSIEELAQARQGKDGKHIPKLTAVEQAAVKLGALAPLPTRAPRSSPIPVVEPKFNARTVTVDQL